MKKALLAIALAAIAGTASANIGGSPHDLSAAGPGQYPGGTLSSCQYCHSPHRSNGTVAAPLWNRITTGMSFTMYTSNTLVNSASAPGANSLTCLSCHDGVSDMGATFTGTRGFAAETRMTDRATTHFVVGQDLRDDHPVGVRYTGTGDYNSITAVTTGANPLRLYGATGTETVECGSCHEPHNDDHDGLPGGPSFLRVGAATICTVCHAK